MLMLSKRSNQLKSTVYVEFGCMFPQVLTGPPAVTLTKWVKWLKYKKRSRCIHHFKSDFINNMDHMRISGTEPSSVILSQTKKFKKLKRDVTKVPKEAEAKRGVM